jgi:hypothetical protein
MATIKFIFSLLCLAFAGSFGLLKNDLLTEIPASMPLRKKLVDIAVKEVGVREKTGNNDGTRIAGYLSAVKLKEGQPYCAAFISWVFKNGGLSQPRSGWCPDLFPLSRQTFAALPGNVVGIYFPELHRIAHVGMITETNGDWMTTVEGNTNLNGSRTGDGVYKKRRHRKTIYRIADWLSGRKKSKKKLELAERPLPGP